MKIVVIGGTGLIGSKLVSKLTAHRHQAIAAAPNTGVNTLTGEGLAEILIGADVVVDVSNSPSFEDKAVMEFFQTSTGNILEAETAAGVGHHVALSVVGTDRLPDSGYMRAKVVQERMIRESSIPYSIVHATQFFEFLRSIADAATVGTTVHLAHVLIQPVAADDVASMVGRTTVGSPLNGMVEIAGPDRFYLDELVGQGLAARQDPREVIADPEARYFGARLEKSSLLPSADAHHGETRLEDWLSRSLQQVQASNPMPAAAESASQEPAILKENEFHLSDVPPGSSLLVGDVVVFNVDGALCATQSKCTHAGGPLNKGPFHGSTVTCPWHGSKFNTCTGAVIQGPAKQPLKTHQVVVDGEIGRIEAGVLV